MSQSLCDDSSTHTKPISSTHVGHHTDSGISTSGGMTSTVSKKETSVSVIPESNNEHLNDAIQEEKGYLNNNRVNISH